jgi:hypothetical protein
VRYTILLQAVTPIAHGDTVTGIDNQTNTRIFMRQGMLVNGKPARVPAISENALRAVLFRGPLHDNLVQRLGLWRGDMPQSVVNLLYSGGNMAAGSKAPGDEIALGHAVKRLYPTLDLLGGAVDGFILPRSRLRMAAWLVAKEYLPALRLMRARNGSRKGAKKKRGAKGLRLPLRRLPLLGRLSRIGSASACCGNPLRLCVNRSSNPASTSSA